MIGFRRNSKQSGSNPPTVHVGALATGGSLSPHSIGDSAPAYPYGGKNRAEEPDILSNREHQERFEREVMRHFDAAYNFALWLVRNPQDAEDATQAALYKAFRAYRRMRGSDAKPWLLAIVRNECMDVIHSRTVRYRFESTSEDHLDLMESGEIDPETASMRALDNQTVLQAIEQLSAEFKEVVILREIEEMSYLEIAQVIDKPVGTVMSRLARARGRLQTILSLEMAQ